ncbi:hypothetical protein [Salinarimonas soli]|uniref:Uncharacterized protein n=1 Tax=Salinarimonas soli TaxID=1638099 RepID=A0A5B2VXB3_9HYPH|nr:hypothetical protein [Salinarimonas soli]KAA2243971.1 hypothetical protein F0L46_01610 [Salinarimonas soli]
MTPLRLALSGLGLLLAVAPATANPYSIYFERQRGTTLILEHNPVPAGIAVARVARSSTVTSRRAMRPHRVAKHRVMRRARVVHRVHRYVGIAGGCRDGGYVQRIVAGRPVPLQSEVCSDVSIRLTGPYVVR